MIGEILFMVALAIGAGAIIWRTVKKKTKKSCCD